MAVQMHRNGVQERGYGDSEQHLRHGNDIVCDIMQR